MKITNPSSNFRRRSGFTLLEMVIVLGIIAMILGGAIFAMRGIGDASIDLSGITGPVSAAYLYWHGPTNSNDAASNAQIVFGATPVTDSWYSSV